MNSSMSRHRSRSIGKKTHGTLSSAPLFLPPPVFENVQPSCLLKHEDGAADGRSVGRSRWESDAVALGVQQSADLSRVTLSLDHILDRGGLHEKGVLAVALFHAVNAFSVAFYEDGRLGRLHEGPHPLVSWDF